MKKRERPFILVVSKNVEEIAILRAGLEISGYRDSVLTASGVEEALRLAAKRPLALLVYDHSPDSRDGIQLCRTLRHDHAVAVLLLGKQEEAEQVEAEAFLSRPYAFQDFLHLVHRFVLPLPEPFSDKSRGTNSLKDERRKYKDLFDRASDIILLMDFDTHIIIDANAQAESAYGYTREEMIGMSLLQIVPRQQHPSMMENTKRLAKEG